MGEKRSILDPEDQVWKVSFRTEKNGAIGILFQAVGSGRAIYVAGIPAEEAHGMTDDELVQLLGWNRRHFGG